MYNFIYYYLLKNKLFHFLGALEFIGVSYKEWKWDPAAIYRRQGRGVTAIKGVVIAFGRENKGSIFYKIENIFIYKAYFMFGIYF